MCSTAGSTVAQFSELSNWLDWFLCRFQSHYMMQQDANYLHGCIIHTTEYLQ